MVGTSSSAGPVRIGVFGGFGNDRLRGNVDGEADLLAGGRGRDRCIGDALDTFVGCEIEIVR